MTNKDSEFLKIYVDLNELIGNALTSVSEVHGKAIHMMFSEAFALMMTRLVDTVAPNLTSNEIFEAMCDGHKGFKEYAMEKFMEDLRSKGRIKPSEIN